MKLNSILSALGLFGILAFVAGLALNVATLALFAVAAGTLVVTIGAADYQTRRHYGARTTAALHRRETMPLAA